MQFRSNLNIVKCMFIYIFWFFGFRILKEVGINISSLSYKNSTFYKFSTSKQFANSCDSDELYKNRYSNAYKNKLWIFILNF